MLSLASRRDVTGDVTGGVTGGVMGLAPENQAPKPRDDASRITGPLPVYFSSAA